ncbi:MAG: stage II sporulation protein P [Eubacteriales bacterium]|nr:stage II sporulation protein P [Eubacteriales bacterium]
MRSKYRVKTIDGHQLISSVLSGIFALSIAILGQGAAAKVAKKIDTNLLKIMFCSAVPASHEYINPKINVNISASNMLFGFNLDDPMSIISSQIAVVSAANKLYDLYEPEHHEALKEPTATPEPTGDIPEKAKKISEINISPKSSKGYINTDKIYVTNQTPYEVDIEKMASESLPYKIEDGAPQVLILHTHASESFTPSDKNYYIPTDPDRTEDINFNIVRVGEEMTKKLNDMGINTIHDKTLHDYPSYSGSYNNALNTIEKYKKQYPSIKVVLDVHRDAMVTSDGTKLKVCTTIDDQKVAQVMILCGTDANGLNHPNWRENFKLALKIQAKMADIHPNFPRPLMLVKERYNMHATTGSLLLEVGSNGNTLEEAILGGRYAAAAIGEVLNSLR